MSSRYALIAEYDAEGGPDFQGKDPSGNAFGPTPPGDFVIAQCAKHHDSNLYPLWSTLAWGTPIRENKGDVEYLSAKRWDSLTTLWNRKKVAEKALHRELVPAETVELVKQRHDELYATAKVPNTWVFNDFGHMTCYFFKDINHNGIFDPKTEKLQSQYIHTTPKDEAIATLYPTQAIVLDKSHGCIHVKPNDIDEMIRKGFLKRGNHIVVHPFSDSAPIMHVTSGDPPYQLHFFPTEGVLQVRGLHHSSRKAH
jgi:hypothetical protein